MRYRFANVLSRRIANLKAFDGMECTFQIRVVLNNRGGEKDENARFNGTKRNYSEHSKMQTLTVGRIFRRMTSFHVVALSGKQASQARMSKTVARSCGSWQYLDWVTVLNSDLF